MPAQTKTSRYKDPNYHKNWRDKNREHVRKYHREYRKKNGRREDPETAAQTRRRWALIKTYGITPEQYDAMLARQGGVCALCGRAPKTRRLAVEHDHHTGRVRGLSCHFCNRQIIGKNTLETAERLVEYLRSAFDGRTIETKAASPIRRKRKAVSRVRQDNVPNKNDRRYLDGELP